MSWQQTRAAQDADALTKLTAEWRTSAQVGVRHQILTRLVAKGLAESTNSALHPHVGPQYGYRLAQPVESAPLPAIQPDDEVILSSSSRNVRLMVGDLVLTVRADEMDVVYVCGYTGAEQRDNLLGMFTTTR